ncbi:MAG: ParB/RepB/Spo0J family partition protein [Phycisphaerae bacterium]|nr:ParB/RepB/Spo0J family partition protein [Phycisphaerae bacterium]
MRIDGDTQPRTAINPGIVQEYAEAMQAGVEFPPITVVHDGATYWLVDGFHRFFAHRRLNRQQIKAEVVAGELADARWLSVAANKAHGLRRTNDDKAKAVIRAIKLKPDLSNPAIAEHVGVGEAMVRRYRESLETRKSTSDPSGSSLTNLQKRVGRDGKRYPARSTKRRGSRRAGGIARNAFKPVRIGGAPARMTALNLPHDPIMGARTLIELFDADYLRALITFLTKHLEGVAA